jgi:hypothetical protein
MSAANRILGRLGADRKKTVLTVCLMVVMAIMWFRVLTGRKPGPAAAAPPSQDEQQEPQKQSLNIRFVKLPSIPGRNDCINRDFFAGREWEPFRQSLLSQNQGTDTEVHLVSLDQAQEVAVRVAQKLKLEAVLWSESPQAYVNDQLLRIGDKLTAKDETNTCEFEVLRIYEDSVLVGCNGTQLTLKLAQYPDVSN